ncbi:Clavaminate synthase-like protein [Penicillium samsonianum]|uniref:Clavaminate synthase-like protein n=1 Tax=Penicillium samsonianum TaxID=1882272 RepID=UPI0025498E79|nr:Clavaminate synthase-like protein [Penicillium samsonianum]KAJ6137147.1 Clavaminate synthase-like protein [Penicillium samsonianum]
MAIQEVDFESIPIIDLCTLNSPCIHQRHQLRREIAQACTQVGFFDIKSHGISDVLINRTYKAAHQLFSLSEEHKMACYLATSEYFRGYSPLYGKKSSNTDLEGATQDKPLGSLSEAFDIGYELSGDLQKEESLLPGFRATYLQYFAEVLELARGLMRIFALALDQDEGYFQSMVKYPGVASRMMHYPPPPVKGQETPGLAAHTDYQCFTGPRPRSSSAGPQPSWEVGSGTADPGTLIVNISDCFAFWTNNKFKSTIHRVANSTGEERHSIPFFGVDYDTTISVGEYIRDKLSLSYVGHDGEAAGDRIKL